MLHVDPSTVSAAMPDPVLALIEAHRAAYAAWVPLAAVWNNALIGTPEFIAAEMAAAEPGRREQAALTALIASRPTTAAGLWALTTYLPGALRQISPDPDTEVQAALDALREGALQLGLAPVASEAGEGKLEEWIILDTRLIHQVRELVAIEAEQTAILESGDYEDAFDAPDWVRLEGHRETILARIIATRAHTMEGLKAKASLIDLESVRAFDQPSRELSRSILADVAAFDVMSQPEQQPAPPAACHTDPHVALLPALRQAFAWTRNAHPVSDRAEFGSPDGRASTAVFQHWWSVANRILALPAPQTPAGLGVVALALSAWSEGSIGNDPETCHEERRTASAIRAMMSIAGTTHFPEWTGFGDEPDSETRWSAMMERAGEGSLPAWALAGKTGPDDGEIATGEEAALAATPALAAPADPPVSDLARACIEQVERMAQWGWRDKAEPRTDEQLDADLDAWGAALQRAIAEPSASTADLAAKAHLLRADMEQFKSEEERTQCSERLMLVILRECIAIGGTASALPPLHPAAAWANLPAEKRDALGATLVDLVFQDFLAGNAYAPEDRIVTDDDQRSGAIDRGDRLLVQVFNDVAAALPALFGPEGEHPAWVEDYRAGRLTISAEGVVS